jgi:N-acetylglucosamine kinase-like BadF-type ATPase
MAWGSLNGPSDVHFRVGGWGEAIGDEGSAFWIGRHALQTISRHLDGRENAEQFSNRILNDLGIQPTQLHSWINSVDERRKVFASLAVMVSDLALSGNTTAQKILSQAAVHLAEHVLAVWRYIKTDKPLTWSYAGGVFNSHYLLEQLQGRLGCAPLPPRLPPIGGALLRASKNAGWSVDDEWISRLAISLEEILNTTSTRRTE